MSSAISAHGGFWSSHAPIHPLGPTYGGLKYLSGRARRTKSCSTETDMIQSPARPALWCAPSEYITKILLLTRNVGVPHASTSCASGNARQISRTRARGVDAERRAGDRF